MIQAVVFDVGGVLVRTEDPLPRQHLERRLGLSAGEAEYLVFNGEMGRAAQMGEITTEALWQWLQAHLNLDDEGLRQFQADFFGGDRLDHAMMQYIRQLRPHYHTAIISNYKDDLHHFLQEEHAIADAFDLIVGSAYEKIMKPDARIFQRTLERLGVSSEESVFIDDFPHNVAGARAVGMHAIHFTPQINLWAELEKLGVSVQQGSGAESNSGA